MPVTLAQLRAKARHLADQDLSTFPTDGQYNDYVRFAAGDLWTKLIMVGATPARTDASIAATGATNYQIGTDVQVVLSVEFQAAADDLRPLNAAQLEDIPALRGLPFGIGKWYVLVDGFQASMKIEFFPKPTSGTYIVRYIPIFSGLTVDGDSFFGPPKMEEYICVAAAIMGMTKEDENTTKMEQRLNGIWEDVIRSLPTRDVQTGRVRDVKPMTVDSFDFPVKGVDDV